MASKKENLKAYFYILGEKSCVTEKTKKDSVSAQTSKAGNEKIGTEDNTESNHYSNNDRHGSGDALLTNKQQEKYKDMCTRFRNLNISGEDEAILYTHGVEEGDFRRGRHTTLGARNLDLHEMEDMKKAQAGTSQSKMDEEAPPPWLMKYLHKMKQEVKEEILEELMNCPRNKIIGHPTSNIKLDENQRIGNAVHSCFCDNCDQLILGVRYKCGACPDYDLCEECESLPNIHNKNHRFLKIRTPLPVKPVKQLCSFVFPSHSDFCPVTKTHVAKKLYEAKFVCDETIPDGTCLPSSTTFIKSWRVLNSGKRVWTHSTKLVHIQGSLGFTPAIEHVDVPHLRPGEEGVVSVLFTTPTVPGVYRSHWNFCHKSRPFGDIVWCHIIVRDPESEEKQVESSSKSLKLPASRLPSEKEKEVASIAKVLTAVKEEHEKGNIIPRKLAVNSHTATPNNTPFDLTPPKSPDHQVMNELKVVLEDKETVPASLSTVEYEEADDDSVVSLSSSESDAEFVVIPMPNCFNLSESLASHNLSHLSQYLQSENVSDPKTSKPTVQKSEKPQTITLKSALNAEMVSQETGVPELSERGSTATVTVIEDEQQILISHVSSDGSSSEISIIDSADSSPVTENVMPDISSIHIAITNDVESDRVERSEGCDKQDTDSNNPERVNNVKADSVQQEIIEKDDQTSDIPGSSATFPKFPVEGITSIYEPASSNTDERTIQVLPEKIVTVPLNVASTVYNATMQAMTNFRRQYIDSQNNPEEATAASSSALNAMDQLIEMGFCNRQQNEELLKKHKNDVALVVGELVNLNDNDWYASRHVPPSAPSFN